MHKFQRLRKFILALPVLFLLLVLADWIWPVDLSTRKGAQIVVDSQGEVLRRFADERGIWRYPTSQQQVSEYYIQALLAYEDRWFYQHPGINPLAMLRACYQLALNGRVVSGGSTLTMQVVRLRYPQHTGGNKGLLGKFLQIGRALQLEWHFSKQDILKYYLNHAPFGGTIEGVETASRHYFGHSAQSLTHAQAALLAGLPQAPSYYRADRHPQRAMQQRNKVLQRMNRFGVLSQQELERALMEDLSIRIKPAPLSAPLLSRRLVNTYKNTARISTYIHRDLQLAAEQLARDNRGFLPAGASISMMVMKHGSGEINAYVGSADFLDASRYGYIDMVTALRSPGSALKPFIYAMALDLGIIHSESLLMDVPLVFSDYRPSNFDVGFSGAVSASQALQKSLNIPAVQLLEQITARAFYAGLQSSGAELVLPAGAKPTLALALGGAGIRLQQLVSLYSSLANHGRVISPKFIRQDSIPESKPLLSEEAAWIVRDILLQADRTRSDRPLALKTGTSSAYRDAWALAVTGQYTIGVWVGMPDNATMSGHYGAQTAVPLLRALAERLPQTNESRFIHTRPDKVKAVDICWPTGTADISKPELCDSKSTAWTINGKTPLTLMHTKENSEQDAKPWLAVKVANDSGLRVDLGCVEKTSTILFPRWPTPLQNRINPSWQSYQRIPELDPRCHKAGALLPTAGVKIQGIEKGQRIKLHAATGNRPILRAEAVGGQPDWYWFLNGTLLTAQANKISLPVPPPGYHQLSVVDQSGQGDQVNFVVEPEDNALP
ncbi:penicillin-binding protein 1C [Psychromonas aquimarina]|uniref:penicillin-binding protein 1C n=1 Tax=Psychromonas aquimarina TaxID=444919 RepID=UPI00041A1ACF|nr:penicillin-binding protein 1C [Psychromonas aquimarina]